MMWWVLLIYSVGAIKMLLLILAVLFAIAAVISCVFVLADSKPIYFLYLIGLLVVTLIVSVFAFATPSSQETAAWIEYTVELDKNHPMYSRIQWWLTE